MAIRMSVAGSLAGLSLAAAAVAGGGGGEFSLTRFTVDGGGIMFSTGGDLELSGTIGQADAGISTGGGFTMSGGFWFPVAPGDHNDDGVVNLDDYDTLEPCLAGPEGGISGPQCAPFDLDQDDDIDLSDVARFQQTFTGG